MTVDELIEQLQDWKRDGLRGDQPVMIETGIGLREASIKVGGSHPSLIEWVEVSERL
jgi:hypothetical protein